MPPVVRSLVALVVAGAALPLSVRTFGLDALAEAATEPDLCPEPPPAVLADPALSADGVTLERLGASEVNKSNEYVLALSRVTIEAGAKIAQNRTNASAAPRPWDQSVVLVVDCGSVAITRTAAPSPHADPRIVVPDAGTSGGTRELAVDDSATLRTGDQALLENAGYEIAAVDGRAVLLLAVLGEQELPCNPCPRYPA
ncbi:MAG: hypothetical protein AVDCRST_MAG73-1800 [uncultured Thermomicrobiales bacterium]|uniref:Uncharacterized protein n=1 Tax=uncultured Thermomicrobiales bacterium TaxID=1645740 RepID=A0A6J4U5S0_9BACT|nr:MAG: hypothetical protein AVDCRST_MAG73-1800 [uncultured Thermomicrobiales bacterium]